MSNHSTAALIAAGLVSKSSVARIPGLQSHLGPVKAISYRVASRIVNNIRAGHPVATYEELDDAGLVLLCAPDHAVTRFIGEMAASRAHWRDRPVVLCDSSLDISVLRPLEQLGARIGTLDAVDGFDARKFVFEGGPAALAALKRLMGATVKVLSIRSKPLYAAALTLGGPLFYPLVSTIVDCLHASGLRASEADAIAVNLLQRSERAWLKAGRKAWSARNLPSPSLAKVQLEQLRATSLLAADYYMRNLALARQGAVSGFKRGTSSRRIPE
jgi:hypothetical protein